MWDDSEAAADRLKRFGEGDRIEDLYVLPYGNDAERMELLRADCKRAGKIIADLRWEGDQMETGW